MTIEFEKLKAKIIRESEKEFEALMVIYPYIVDTGHLIDKTIPDDYLYTKNVCMISDHVKTILSSLNLQSSEYRLYPSVIGKYNKYSNSVMFRDPDTAMMFKLML